MFTYIHILQVENLVVVPNNTISLSSSLERVKFEVSRDK